MRYFSAVTSPIVYLQYFRSFAALSFFGVISTYNSEKLSFVIFHVLIIQILESFFTSGVDYQFKKFKNILSRSDIRLFIINVRLHLLLILSFFYFSASFFYGTFNSQDLLIVLILLFNAFFVLGYYFESEEINFFRLIVYSFTNILVLICIYYEYLSFWWFLLVHFTLIPIVGLKGYFYSYKSPKEIFPVVRSLAKYWQINIFTLSYTNFNVLLISYYFVPVQAMILFYIDKLRSVFITVLVPLNKLAFKNSLNEKIDSDFFRRGLIESLVLGALVSLVLVALFPVYQKIIATNIAGYEWWFAFYFAMPIPVSMSLFLAYVCLTNLSKESLLRDIYFKVFIVYILAMPVIVFFKESYLVGLTLFSIEIITTLMLFIYVRKSI